MPGVPPNPNAIRRNPRPGVVLLPMGGRTGEPPRWPLDLRSNAELGIWRELWSSPQAVAWERQGLSTARVVARYCRVLRAAEELDDKAMAEARQLEDRLGLTPKSMRMLMWQIAPDEIAEKRDDRPATGTGARGRIKAVG